MTLFQVQGHNRRHYTPRTKAGRVKGQSGIGAAVTTGMIERAQEAERPKTKERKEDKEKRERLLQDERRSHVHFHHSHILKIV